MKLVVRESETRSLIAYLRNWPDRVTSTVAAVEVRRAARARVGWSRPVRRADRLLERIDLVELDASIRARAALLEPPGVRALDAIHVATALDLGEDVSVFVTYDEGQASAARQAGAQVLSPGRG